MKFRSPLQFKSIHTSFAIAFSCLILCTTVILSFTSYQLSADAVTENSRDYTTELINQVNINIETYIENMESISTLALSNDNLKRYLSNPNTAEKDQLSKQVSSFFQSIVESRNDIASIMFVDSSGEAVSDRSDAQVKSYPELSGQEWYKQAIEAQGRVVISSSHVQHIYQKEYRWVVSISRQLDLDKNTTSSSGVLLVDLNYNVINDLAKQIRLGQRGYVFIVDPLGNLIYHPQQQIIYTALKSEEIPMILSSPDGSIVAGKGSDSKIYTIRTNRYGWKVVGTTYADELIVNKKEIQFNSALWGIICLIIALAISILLSYTLTKPIKRLDAHMKKAEKGDFDNRVEIESSNEIGKLSRTFNLMIGKIKDLMNQIVEEQEMKRISELKALQAQIQPHFLYNTLDSIIWMAETGKMDEVVEMTSALSKLLRSSISKGEELIPIAVELEHIHNYLTIQNIRYRNKFTYSIDVDPSIHECKILKIILQPLVENAIYHGIKHMAGVSHIQITGRRYEGYIEIQVSDDGIGMNDEQLRYLISRINMTEGVKGVGIHNVNHRIKLYFGRSYGLTFESELEEGTTVTVRIPELEGEG